MIKFFRKIRQIFLLQGKSGKYFKYAIGEIILVVIGILIALSINNWNQNRLEKNRAYSYLNQVRSDLEADLKYIDKMLSLYTDNLMIFEEAKSSDFENDSVLNELSKVLTINSDPREFPRAYTSLVNSGAIELIDEKELIEKINLYYLTTCVKYNNVIGYHKDFNLQNIEGVLVHRLELDDDGNFSPESIREEIESGSLASIINWQINYLKRFKSLAIQCRDQALIIQELIPRLE